MRIGALAMGFLLSMGTACSGGPAATKRAELDAMLAPARTTPDAAPAASAPLRSGEVAPQATPAPQAAPQATEMTAEDRQDEIRELLEARMREGAAMDVLNDSAAVEVEHGGIVVTLANDLLFAPGDAALLPSSRDLMGRIASALLVTKDRDMVIEGHTDSKGEDGIAIDLSRQRAEALRIYFIAQGYPASRIRAQGIGQDHPVSTNSNEKGREKNRRMEITISLPRNGAL